MLVWACAAAGSARSATAITAVDSSGYLVFMIASLVAPDNLRLQGETEMAGERNTESIEQPSPPEFPPRNMGCFRGARGRYPGSGTPARAVRLPLWRNQHTRSHAAPASSDVPRCAPSTPHAHSARRAGACTATP